MIWLNNGIYQFGFYREKNGKLLEKIEFNEKEISDEINTISAKLHENNMNMMKAVQVVSAVVDVGTVHNHHNLEKMITAPGIFKPFLYDSIVQGTKEEYQLIIKTLHNELYQQNATLAGVCGDNLAAQKTVLITLILLNNRFHNTARWDLLITAYALSPYGREELTNSNYIKISPYSPPEIKFFEVNEIDSSQVEGGKIKKL